MPNIISTNSRKDISPEKAGVGGSIPSLATIPQQVTDRRPESLSAVVSIKNRPRLHIRPVSWKKACRFIDSLHRHHNAPRGAKWAIAVHDQDGNLRGVATAGRPVSRHFDDGFTVEVNRTCTDGCPNANSALYGACVRIAAAMGYHRIITYTQEGESGASLRAVGWKMVAIRQPRKNWAESSVELRGLRDPEGPGGVQRQLWERAL